MQIQKIFNLSAWCIPLLLYSYDANAWGLYTHLHFAQNILLGSPLLDRRFRDAIRRFPELVTAGAYLPDLAVISKQFKGTHQWAKAELLLVSASTDEETAIAVGYASHLFVDVIAHNHFVPAHEALWGHDSILTHIASEWAMDAHISHTLDTKPGRLLIRHANILSRFIEPCFNQSRKTIKKKLIHLAYADYLLRAARLPSIIYRAIHFINRNKCQHFDYYIRTTNGALREFHKAIQGHWPSWHPEMKPSESIKMAEWRALCLQDLNRKLTTPIHYYKM